jgi:hypothetical protein
MAKAANSKFRSGSGVYVCRCCGIRTRETGSGEAGCELCVDCFEIAGIDNGINDDGRAPTERERVELEQRVANIASKGGSVATVREWNTFAFPKVSA